MNSIEKKYKDSFNLNKILSLSEYILSNSDISEEDLLVKCHVDDDSIMSSVKSERKLIDMACKLAYETGKAYICEKIDSNRDLVLEKYITADKNVVIDKDYEYIDQECFSLCPNLESIEITGHVKWISHYSCNENRLKLTTLIFHDFIRFSYMAFGNCENLETIIFHNGAGGICKGTFVDTKWYKSIKGPFVTYEDVLLEYTGDDAVVVVPDGIKIIAANAFSNISEKDEFIKDSKITEIILPEGLKTIEYGAFEGQTNLLCINIPEGVEVIESSAFSFCDNIREIILPKSIKEIGDPYYFGGSNLVNTRFICSDTPIMREWLKETELKGECVDINTCCELKLRKELYQLLEKKEVSKEAFNETRELIELGDDLHSTGVQCQILLGIARDWPIDEYSDIVHKFLWGESMIPFYNKYVAARINRDGYSFIGRKAENSAEYYDTVLKHGYDGNMDYLAWDAAHKFGSLMMGSDIASFSNGILKGKHAAEAAYYIEEGKTSFLNTLEKEGRKEKLRTFMREKINEAEQKYNISVELML